MSKKFLVFVVMFASLALAGSLLAQENPPAPDRDQRGGHRMGGPPTMGTITSVGVDRFEIKKSDGTTQTVMVNDQTRYRQRSAQQDQPPQELALEDLKVGDNVIVRGAAGNDKQFVAEGVNRVTPEQVARFQSAGQGGPAGGNWGGGMEGTRAGGEIESIKGNVITVMSRRMGERVIVVNDQTTFDKDGQTINLKSLKIGDRIFAMGKEVDGKFVATQVRSGRPHGEGRGGPGQQGPQN